MKQYKYSELPKYVQKEIDRQREWRNSSETLFEFDPCGEMLYYNWATKTIELLGEKEELLEAWDKKDISTAKRIMKWFIENQWNKKHEVIVLLEK